MKKVIITFAILIATMVAGNAQDRTPRYTKDGKTFVQQKGGRASSSADQATPYKWEDSKGNVYPIFLHTYTKGEKAGRTTCYVVKTSAKTGKEYKYYIPDGEAIAADILGEAGRGNINNSNKSI